MLNFQFYPHICRIEILVIRLETMRYDKIIAIDMCAVIIYIIIDQFVNSILTRKYFKKLKN